jgi:Zn-dependent peptidase ImmA (M78 family)
MSDIVFEAPPRSGENIEDLADAIRKMFGLEDETFFPVVAFVEKGLPHLVEGLVFDIVDAQTMGARMGAVNPLTREFLIREDVYDGAVLHHPRHRFTLSHEAGHAVMHIGTLNRMAPSASVATYRDPEWQANSFAAALLMPRGLVRQCKSVEEIMRRFGVSKESAELRVKTLKLEIYT